MNINTYFLVTLFLIPTVNLEAADKENVSEVPFEYLVDGQEELAHGLQQDWRNRFDSQIFELDPYQKPVDPLYRGWRLQRLMKNPAIELANDFASYVANHDLATVQEKLAKDPWLVNCKDDRGYFPVFTAIENEKNTTAFVLFKKMKNKNTRCNGRPIRDYIEEELAFCSGEKFQIQRDQEAGLAVEEKRKRLDEKLFIYSEMQRILNAGQRTIATQTQPATLHTKDKKSTGKCGKSKRMRTKK